MFRYVLRMTTIGAVALAGSAFAADLPPPPPVYIPTPIFTWTGVYVGGQIGYAWGQSATNFGDSFDDHVAFNNNNNNNLDGVIGGAHVGYNLQLNQFVIGVEGDVDGMSLNRQYTATGFAFGNNSPVTAGIPLMANGNITVHHNIEGSIRGRLGYAWDRVLLYATGGVAFGGFNTNFNGSYIDPIGEFPPGSFANSSASTTRVGWTVGGGLEYAVTNNWSVRAEYRYTDFGHSTLYSNAFDTSLLGPAGAVVNRNFRENRVQVGFSYKFDTAPLPLPFPIPAPAPAPVRAPPVGNFYQ